MRVLHTTLIVIGLVATGLLIGGCSDRDSLGGETVGAETSEASSQNAGPGGSSSATVYRASLSPLGSSRVTGEAMVRVKGDRLLVSVNAKDLKPSVEHAQHFHVNASCDNFGSILVSLDDDISNEPGDGTNADPGDDSFPTATPGGTVNYREKDSKEAVETALGESLDLANRTVVVHKAGTPIGPATACGELNPVGN